MGVGSVREQCVAARTGANWAPFITEVRGGCSEAGGRVCRRVWLRPWHDFQPGMGGIHDFSFTLKKFYPNIFLQMVQLLSGTVVVPIFQKGKLRL